MATGHFFVLLIGNLNNYIVEQVDKLGDFMIYVFSFLIGFYLMKHEL